MTFCWYSHLPQKTIHNLQQAQKIVKWGKDLRGVKPATIFNSLMITYERLKASYNESKQPAVCSWQTKEMSR